LGLAQRLIADLSKKKFDAEQYKDNYRERVLEVAEQKMAGHEVTEGAPEVRRANVIDLMSALKASLKKRGVEIGSEGGAKAEESAATEHVEKERAHASKVSRRPSAKRQAR
jgi:DNA end-binding protein Ku